jgi:osmoprotectant transport system permease protein
LPNGKLATTNPGVSFWQRLPLKAGFGILIAAFVGWYMFIADTAADNDFISGIGDLVSGIVNLPALLLDTSAYSNFWDYAVDDEGLGEIAKITLEHAQLVLAAMFWAVIIAIGLGILVNRVRPLAGFVVGFSSILLTIPSLAFFAILISVPAIGIGDRGPIIALIAYSILPILRNTVTGLEGVDRAVVESAKGMGMSALQRLVRVEMPLAWPVILTGIRIATLLAVGIAAIAVLVGGSGLGVYINDGLTRYPNPGSVERMWVGVVSTIALALLLDLMFGIIRKFTTPKGLR